MYIKIGDLVCAPVDFVNVIHTDYSKFVKTFSSGIKV